MGSTKIFLTQEKGQIKGGESLSPHREILQSRKKGTPTEEGWKKSRSSAQKRKTLTGKNGMRSIAKTRKGKSSRNPKKEKKGTNNTPNGNVGKRKTTPAASRKSRWKGGMGETSIS